MNCTCAGISGEHSSRSCVHTQFQSASAEIAYQFGKKGDWAYDALENILTCAIAFYLALHGKLPTKRSSIIQPLAMDFPKDKKVLEMDTKVYVFGRNFRPLRN